MTTCTVECCSFFRVPEENSFFSEEVKVELENHEFNQAHKFCKCEKQADGTGAVTCNYHYDVDNCQVGYICLDRNFCKNSS